MRLGLSKATVISTWMVVSATREHEVTRKSVHRGRGQGLQRTDPGDRERK